MAILQQGATQANALKAFAFRNALKEMFNLGMTGRNGLATEAYMFSRYGTDWAAWIQAAGRTATGRENMLFGIRHSWNLLGAYFAAAGVRGWTDYGEGGDDDGHEIK